MPLTQFEQTLIAAQLIKVHDGNLSVDDLEMIHSVQTLIRGDATHIEYQIALVETDDEKAIFVIFPGSNDLDDWMANFRFGFQDMLYKAFKKVNVFVAQTIQSLTEAYYDFAMTQPHADHPNADDWKKQRVHSGFMSAYYGIKESILRDLHNILETFPDANVYGVGHSLGSAMLRFVFLDAQFNGFFDQRKAPMLVTFGAPRMGNAAFVKAFSERLPRVRRVVHCNDLVPRLPLPLFGYRHEIKEFHIGKRRFLRFYYKQDIRDHYMESYVATLDKMVQDERRRAKEKALSPAWRQDSISPS